MTALAFPGIVEGGGERDVTFGRVTVTPSSWIIQCEPHVRAKLKRLFPRAPKDATHAIAISLTPENSRDLEWFLGRYPMRVDRPEILARQADIHRATEHQMQELMRGHRPALDVQLALPPREYQTYAAQMLEIKGGLLLADDVGLGKTVTSICSMVLPGNLPALVVCPTQLPYQWQEMIARFAPGLSTHVISKGKPYTRFRYRRGEKQGISKDLPDVLIVNYHKLKTWAEYLCGHVKLVVFDEVQQLRSGIGTQIYKAASHVAGRAHRRLGLSATPIYNYGSEFFWVVDAVLPGCLGERDEFVREWCVAAAYGEKARIQDTKEFGSYLRREGIMLRRTREDVGRELPELSKVVQHVDSDPEALNKVKGNAVELARVILGHNERYRGEKMQAAGEFDALMRQATGIAKAPYVAEFVRLLLESEERVVLFGWHREVYELWLESLKEFSPLLYTGTESPLQKAEHMRKFVAGESRILVISLRSGAGLDGLQGSCRTVVFGELDWSPGVHEQCIGRVHRDGQDEPCVAYFLVAEDGADPVIVKVLGIKREQIEGVRNPDRALAERIDTGENNIKRLAREFLNRRGTVKTEQVQPIAGNTSALPSAACDPEEAA